MLLPCTWCSCLYGSTPSQPNSYSYPAFVSPPLSSVGKTVSFSRDVVIPRLVQPNVSLGPVFQSISSRLRLYSVFHSLSLLLSRRGQLLLSGIVHGNAGELGDTDTAEEEVDSGE